VTESDDTLDRVVRTLREPVEVAPDLASRVMAEIERTRALPGDSPPGPDAREGRGRRLAIRPSPLAGLAIAAGLAALVFAGSWLSRSEPDARPSDVVSPANLTQFVLVAPDAGAVSLIGDFNDWDTSATPLVRAAGDGVWSVTLRLTPGRYRYSFLVDGVSWRVDPDAPVVSDEFGRSSSVLTIGGA
jgi:hypothetical protein